MCGVEMGKQKKQPMPQFVQVTFPVAGIDTSNPASQQLPGTCADALNVRSYEPGTDRERGGSRQGIQKYVTSPQLGSAIALLHFNGTQWATATDETGLPSAHASFTVTARIKTAATPVEVVCYGTNPTPNAFVRISVASHTLKADLGGNQLAGAVVVDDDVWHFIALVYTDGAGWQLWVDTGFDGVQAAVTPAVSLTGLGVFIASSKA